MIMQEATKARLADISLSDITVDAGLQSRAEMNEEAIDTYAENYQNKAAMPPVVLFYDGADYWLAGGFHRAIARQKAGFLAINAEIYDGTKTDALLYAVQSNHDNGVRRSNADKHRAVEMLLSHEDFRTLPVSQIAKKCKVSRSLVESAIESILPKSKIPTVKQVTRNGTTYEMQTANIGAKPDAPTQETRPPADEPSSVPGELDEWNPDEANEEAPQSFVDEPCEDDPPVNKFRAFYDLITREAEAILADAEPHEHFVLASQLHAIAEGIELKGRSCETK